MPEIANVVQISDLHFVKDLTEKGRKLRFKGLVGPKSHGFGRLDAFSNTFHRLRPLPELLLITGDICTDGTQEALATGLEFIKEGYIYRGTPGRLVTRGLGMLNARRVVLPGNHDRYSGRGGVVMVENDRLEQTFGPQPSYPYKYPYSLGYRRSEHISDTEAPSLIFFVFDSTASVIARQQNPLQRTPIYGAARGRIEHAECEWLVDEADRIAEKSQIAGLDGSEMSIQYDKAVRIALIHHYPVRANERLHLRDQTTLMEQSELFVEACLDARVDLVLFGHQHQTYRDERVKNGHRTYFFCCPSTAEYSAEDAGFYSFSFHEDYFQEALYCWRKPFFRLTENRTYGYSR